MTSLAKAIVEGPASALSPCAAVLFTALEKKLLPALEAAVAPAAGSWPPGFSRDAKPVPFWARPEHAFSSVATAVRALVCLYAADYNRAAKLYQAHDWLQPFMGGALFEKTLDRIS